MSVPLPLDEQLCFSLYATSLAVIRAYKPKLDELGVTYPQYLVLHALWEADGSTIGAIAERLALESSNVTPLVKRVEAAGFDRLKGVGDGVDAGEHDLVLELGAFEREQRAHAHLVVLREDRLDV